ncbi:CCHC-type domain-containing protein [Abeliophyllum distichum]|uniref:CCHC-type domain-containing protein n=1 Tax=Abeliophyllum distichum TaxID=126358 RepID=A0ABD1NTV8_9LAMI
MILWVIKELVSIFNSGTRASGRFKVLVHREDMSIKYDVEKFDGIINFDLWQVQVKNALIQSGLHKALKGKPTPVSDKHTEKSNMSDEVWEDLDLKAASTIHLCLAKNVLANNNGISAAKELYEKLEQFYQTNSLSNRLYLKEQFYSLRMNAGTNILDHSSVMNGIISELEAIGIKLDDEDKALRLIWSLPSSYEYIKPILMYGKETVSFEEVTSKLIFEERRLSGGSNISSENSLLVAEKWKKNNSMKRKIFCWNCGQPGLVRKNCSEGGVGSANCSTSDTDNMFLFMGDDKCRLSKYLHLRGIR